MNRFADPNEAAEATFVACQTEEQGLRATFVAEVHLTQDEATTLMAYVKPQAKKKLLEEVAKARSAGPQ